MKKIVTTIPATKSRFTKGDIGDSHKRRVAAYARVSTDSDEQATSYEAQVDYYTNFIKKRADWEFVKVYADEGITGTSTKHREAFRKMVKDSLSGKIDLIVTKSVSRFARNTVDSLTTVRKLKEKNVEIYFEKENIWTLDSKGELLITIMSSLAQEESRSISENCTWGQRKRFADGKVTVPFKHFLGYDRGEDGNLIINHKEAKIVKYIYELFLEGLSIHLIARRLTAENIPTPNKKKKWSKNTVLSILTNEKYKGDALLQKTYTTDFLTKAKKINEGEVPQYYVTNNHEAIIRKEVHEFVAAELSNKTRHSNKLHFSGRIKCSDCGEFYGSKIWHSNSKYKRRIWQCNAKFKNKCETPHFTNEELEDAFMESLNKLLENRESIKEDIEILIATLYDVSDLEKRKTEISKKIEEKSKEIETLVNKNSKSALDQTDYQKEYDKLNKVFYTLLAEMEEVDERIDKIRSKKIKAEQFIRAVDIAEREITKFNPLLLNSLVESIDAKRDKRLVFNFKNKTSI